MGRDGEKRNFDWQMHYFRAFAILMIMATHYCGVFGFNALDQYFFRSSTIFFLFISGFLCQYLFNSRPQPPITYYKKKLQHVICPFLIFSVGIGLLRGDSTFSFGFWRDVALGRIQLQYWYIPFVSILFLVSPLLCRLNNRLLLSVSAISLVIFCAFPVRPAVGFALSWSHTFHLYAYFTVFYLLGFVYCRYKAQMFAAITRHVAIIAMIAVAATIVMPYAKAHVDAINAIQKLAIGSLVLIVLDMIKGHKIWILDLLAKHSFTLYFIHLGIYLQTVKFHDLVASRIPIPVISELVVFCLYVAAMLLIASLPINKVTKRKGV